ncbi:MAG: hypothetical protein ACTSSG_00720 [Candidatus Heimdallarchaeaceae archaeon]
MIKCKHTCEKCGEEWECSFPYYSNHQYLEEFIEHGNYCNAYCPICSPKERKKIDLLFENVQETGYIIMGKKKATDNVSSLF